MRQAREIAGLTLEDLTRRTKIPLTRLTALEASDVPNLPAAVYTRGFVKAYAAEVGLDPDKTANEYLAAVAESQGHSPPPVEPPLPAAPPHVREYDVDHRIVARNSQLARLTTVGAAIGLLFYVVSINRVTGRQTPSGTDETSVLAPTGSAADNMPNQQPPSVLIANGAAVTAEGPLDLELLSQGPCWLVLTVDGERVLMRLLQAGERLSFAVTHEALLRVGDPSAMSLTINGRSVRALGPPGQPVNVTISRDNFKQLLSS